MSSLLHQGMIKFALSPALLLRAAKKATEKGLSQINIGQGLLPETKKLADQANKFMGASRAKSMLNTVQSAQQTGDYKRLFKLIPDTIHPGNFFRATLGHARTGNLTKGPIAEDVARELSRTLENSNIVPSGVRKNWNEFMRLTDNKWKNTGATFAKYLEQGIKNVPNLRRTLPGMPVMHIKGVTDVR